MVVIIGREEGEEEEGKKRKNEEEEEEEEEKEEEEEEEEEEGSCFNVTALVLFVVITVCLWFQLFFDFPQIFQNSFLFCLILFKFIYLSRYVCS